MFTTTPRSSTLAREIASDATISVSLLREVRIDAIIPRYTTPTASSTPSTSSDESDMPPVSSRRLLRRVVKSSGTNSRAGSLTRTTSRTRTGGPPSEKPLPQLPSPGISESRALYTDVSVGFPKRPRYRCEPGQRHPTLEEHKALPDGLYKGKIQLDKHMLPTFDWAGVRVKVRCSVLLSSNVRLTRAWSQYYLDVSVIFGQDQLRARVPLRIS